MAPASGSELLGLRNKREHADEQTTLVESNSWLLWGLWLSLWRTSTSGYCNLNFALVKMRPLAGWAITGKLLPIFRASPRKAARFSRIVRVVAWSGPSVFSAASTARRYSSSAPRIFLGFEQAREIVHGQGRIRMVRSQRLLRDSQSSPVERLRGGVVPFRFEQARQVVQRTGRIRMVGPRAFSAMFKALRNDGSAPATSPLDWSANAWLFSSVTCSDWDICSPSGPGRLDARGNASSTGWRAPCHPHGRTARSSGAQRGRAGSCSMC